MKAASLLAIGLVCLLPGAAFAERVDLKLVGQQGDHYFFSLPGSHAKNQAYITHVATQFCSYKTFCYVGFWQAGKSVPKRFPFTDGQVKAQLATYRQNKNTGHVVLLWNCKQFPKEPESKCFSQSLS